MSGVLKAAADCVLDTLGWDGGVGAAGARDPKTLKALGKLVEFLLQAPTELLSFAFEHLGTVAVVAVIAFLIFGVNAGGNDSDGG